ncbi:hypothetical protein [Salinispora cortesiana]|uniref:hypothetical protein n=1 Tax=Salinispora cortesiana TaxID=1305843 RepID=UPI0004022541|nr:hypothetical protein [Salinispora cortesiana]
MAEESPLSDGELTEYEYERLASATAADGLIGTPADPPPVSVSGGQAIVRAGLSGVFRGYPWSSGSSAIALSPSLDGPERYDLLVVRLDRTGGHVLAVALVTGTPGNPAPDPAGGTGPADVWEFALAELRIADGVLTLHQRRGWWLGADGGIVCTSTVRPPHTPGRRIWETDTEQLMVSDGVMWHSITPPDEVSQVALYFDWVASPNRILRRNGSVYLQLSPRFAGPAVNSISTIGNIPERFRPTEDLALYAAMQGTSADITVFVYANTGNITVTVHSQTGISNGEYMKLQAASWDARR